MKYTVDTIVNGVWFTHSKEIITEDNFEKQELVNNSQELVKELVKEQSERPQGSY